MLISLVLLVAATAPTETRSPAGDADAQRAVAAASPPWNAVMRTTRVATFYEACDIRCHGKDERVGARAFYAAPEFPYRLVKELSR